MVEERESTPATWDVAKGRSPLIPEANGGTLAAMSKEREPTRFGKRLRELRERAGLTVAQLAEAAGVSRQAVSQWENGTRAEPVFSIACRLADALGVPVTALR